MRKQPTTYHPHAGAGCCHVFTLSPFQALSAVISSFKPHRRHFTTCCIVSMDHIFWQYKFYGHKLCLFSACFLRHSRNCLIFNVIFISNILAPAQLYDFYLFHFITIRDWVWKDGEGKSCWSQLFCCIYWNICGRLIFYCFQRLKMANEKRVKSGQISSNRLVKVGKEIWRSFKWWKRQ